jgi:hypothetical protein
LVVPVSVDLVSELLEEAARDLLERLTVLG